MNRNVYRILVTTHRAFTAEIEVEAANEKEARVLAVTRARNDDPAFTTEWTGLDWSEDDYSPEPPYEAVQTTLAPA